MELELLGLPEVTSVRCLEQGLAMLTGSAQSTLSWPLLRHCSSSRGRGHGALCACCPPYATRLGQSIAHAYAAVWFLHPGSGFPAFYINLLLQQNLQCSAKMWHR